MAEQSYARHAHRPRLSTIAGLFTFVAMLLLVIFFIRYPSIGSIGVLLLSFGVGTLVLISRAYTVRLQDRIIRLEMHGRLSRFGRDRDFSRLSMAQIAGLGFAHDAELPAMLERNADENYSTVEIKGAIM